MKISVTLIDEKIKGTANTTVVCCLSFIVEAMLNFN